MTILEMIKAKGYNPLKTEMVKRNSLYFVRDKATKKLITTFRFSEDGTKHIIIK